MFRFWIIIVLIQFSCQNKKTDYFAYCEEQSPNYKYEEIVDSVNGFRIEIPNQLWIKEPYSYFKFVAWDTTSTRKDSIMNSIALEHYNLNERTFDEFYSDIKERTEKTTKNTGYNEKVLERDEVLIGLRNAKYTSVSLEQKGVKFINTTFYIEDSDRALVISIGTTDKNYKNAICKFQRTIKSFRGI